MAYPVTLNGRTYTLADFEGQNYVDGLPDAFEDFVTHAGNLYSTTSTTSNSIGTGSKTFTVESSKPYQVGTPLRITDSAAPTTNWMDAIVTSYSGTTLTVSSVSYAGSGTKTSWNINIGGGGTSYTGTLPVAQGGTGGTTEAAARTNLDVYSKSEADSRFLNVSGETDEVTVNAVFNIETSNNNSFNIIDTSSAFRPTVNFLENDGGTETLLNMIRSERGEFDFYRASSGTAIKAMRIKSDGDVAFYANDGTSENMIWESSASNLLIGKSTTSVNSNGIEMRNGGLLAASRDQNPTAYFTRTTDGGPIALFYVDGTNVGNIGSFDQGGVARVTFANQDNNGIGLRRSSSAVCQVIPVAGAEESTAGSFDIGTADFKFGDIYLNGGVFLGGTAAVNRLDSYEEGTWTPSLQTTSNNLTTTYSRQEGVYRKIGSVIYLGFDIQLASVSGGTGDVRIHDLPFTIKNANIFPSSMLGVVGNAGADFHGVRGDEGTNRLRITVVQSGSSPIETPGPGILTNNTRISGSIVIHEA